MADMTRVRMSIRGAEVVTVPIDNTLTIEGQAADAKATGDALALKADKSELQAAVKVNNQPADAQGLILIDGRHIPVSDQDEETLAVAVTDLKGKTAENIPMSSDSGAKTIAEVVNANAEAIENMEEMTGATMPIESGSQTTVKAAIEARVKTVNKKAPDADGDVDLSVVPLAENLQSDKMESVEGAFIMRTTGGNASVSDGKAYPLHLFGTAEHTGYVEELLDLTVIPITRTEPDVPITATIDRDTFVAYVDESDTINLYFTTEWSENPELYGITVIGTPVAGDQITVVYVKEERGTITVADPERLVGTGWNLFDFNNGYARVVKYSNEYGYKIGGSYASLKFSATLTGERSSITPGDDGLFNVPSDGYVFVNGGNNTDTYILATWSDWMEGPSSGYWEPYRESGIDLSAVMTTYFPNGMLAVGDTHDEIDMSAKRAISRIERMAYSEENRAAAAATGRSYDFDENYIYIERETSVLSAITIDVSYNVSEHGMEWFTETSQPVITEILYGKNLRDKLERDVVTISQQTLAEEEKAQVRRNIGVMDPPLNGNGTAAQLLKTNGDGTTEWTTQGTPTDAQVGTAVSAWMTAHPEATTTVQDGAISRAKLNDDLKAKTDAVPDLKSMFNYSIIQDSGISEIPSSSAQLIQGAYNSLGGTTSNDKRIRTKAFIPVSKGQVVKFSAGPKITNLIIGYFSLDGTFITSGSQMSDGGSAVMDNNYNLIFMYRDRVNNVDQTITPSDYDAKTVITSSWLESVDFVTPEMFGAVGNGVTDDANAFLKALKTGRKIICKKGATYLIDQATNDSPRQSHHGVYYNGNVDIDFNGAKLKMVGRFLFEAPNTSTTGVSYTANSISLTGDYEDGIVNIYSDQKFDDNEDQYVLGFSSVVYKNSLSYPFKYDILTEDDDNNQYNTVCTYYQRRTLKIRNIGDIISDGTQVTDYLACFHIVGYFCDVENVTAVDYEGLQLFMFISCKFTCRNFYVNSSIQRVAEGHHSYGIVVFCCSGWICDNINGNARWHTISTGGNKGFSTNGIIKNSCMRNRGSSQYETQSLFSYGEHSNTYGTIIDNCEIHGILLNGGTIINSNILDRCAFGTAEYEQYKENALVENTTISITHVDLRQVFMNEYQNKYFGKLCYRNCTFNLIDGFIIDQFRNEESSELLIDNCVFNCSDQDAKYIIASRYVSEESQYYPQTVPAFKKVIVQNIITNYSPTFLRDLENVDVEFVNCSFDGYVNNESETEENDIVKYKNCIIGNADTKSWTNKADAVFILCQCQAPTEEDETHPIMINCYDFSYSPISNET